jgi:protein tyrosine phosphatase domain-containing protein 1
MELTEIPFGLAGRVFRCPMPFSLHDPERTLYDSFKEESISTVVVLAEEGEPEAVTGMDLLKMYSDDGYNLLFVPTLDFSVPSRKMLTDAIDEVVLLASEGKNIAVHCHAGVGRTGVFLAAMAKSVLDMSGEEAIVFIRKKVPLALQTESQCRFVTTD